MVVDTSAIVSLVRGEDGSGAFARAMSGVRCFLCAVSLVECRLVLSAAEFEDARFVIAELEIEVAPFTPAAAELAVAAAGKYRGGKHGLNFGDCCVYGLAASLALPLLFKGADFSNTDIVPA